ncbi:hypothetical protein TSAR_015085 [Trichomalopsis sarcophagae]|uniref:Protein kinase domain-containing protein n=1 Tax=Trichomalopsis sarcophagae TaxID=543379 RepID=A0A232F945_9HYME|nr:hypothetical protein TSAR_015085 [Trichomalopsis sarcophagae]
MYNNRLYDCVDFCGGVRCMKLVQHPNVVRLYEVIDTHTKLYLILELGDGGDLYDYIMRYEGGLTEEVSYIYLFIY